MKIYNKQSKNDRNSKDFYFGNYGEIDLGISSATFENLENSEDKLHFHKAAKEYYITTNEAGLIEIEGKEYEMNTENLIMVEPGEKHKVLKATKPPFSFIVISTIKAKDDKVVVEN